MRKLCIAFGLLLPLLAWSYLGFPLSWDNVVFFTKLNYSSVMNKPEIDLGSMMPGDWEMACQSDGYGGPAIIEKYNKSFPPSGYMQEGWWGIIFIAPDGSYKSATAVDVSVNLDGCVERSKALLRNYGGAFILPEESKASGVRFP